MPVPVASERTGEHQGSGDKSQENDQADRVVDGMMPGHIACVDAVGACRQLAAAVVAG